MLTYDVVFFYRDGRFVLGMGAEVGMCYVVRTRPCVPWRLGGVRGVLDHMAPRYHASLPRSSITFLVIQWVCFTCNAEGVVVVHA